ncbi:bifunctional DNA-formamidopyrimidine glycosylase/DNA-(apurinic or apyrimidinic site) lyase [Pirellulales bacterium]|nr:bifunctional DNA-formamidopyrimidine glycosylase/DNA-(apurinic or apyrimidinic site) lyase [Pirellulales bacterium]
MPELPEVETMRRGIAGAAGTRIDRIERTPCRRKPIAIGPSFAQLRRRAEGAQIERTDRLGKRVVLWLSTGDALVFEPRMTGLVLCAAPPTNEHLRLRIILAGGKTRQLLYWDRRGLGQVHLHTPQTYEEQLEAALGPDALTITADDYRESLGKSARVIKVALLDQRAVAGIGNLYAAEILHVAGISPRRQCRRLTRRAWHALAEATRDVLAEAIRYEGSTLSDGTYRNALNQQGRYQNKHRVYAKAGERCPRCNEDVIKRIVQAQRSTFYCPRCQRG